MSDERLAVSDHLFGVVEHELRCANLRAQALRLTLEIRHTAMRLSSAFEDPDDLFGPPRRPAGESLRIMLEAAGKLERLHIAYGRILAAYVDCLVSEPIPAEAFAEYSLAAPAADGLEHEATP